MKILLSELEYREKTHPGYLKAFLERGKVNEGRLEIPLADYLEVNENQLKIIRKTQVEKSKKYSIIHPGDLLAFIIHKTIGTKSSFCMACNNRQKQMNTWGWVGCWENRQLIINWLVEEARRKGYFFGKPYGFNLFKVAFTELFLKHFAFFKTTKENKFYKTKMGKEIFIFIEKNLHQLEINEEKLEEEKYRVNPSALEMFLDYWKNPLFIRSTKTCKRIFHTLVQSPKECRKFLKLKTGEEPVEMDFPQTFPTFLLSLYEDKYCEEAERFKDLLRAGEFYNFVTQGNTDLENPKGKFMKFLFSSHADAESLAWQLISESLEKFPILYKKIIEKRGAQFSVELQNLEAEIFIEGVISKCLKKNIFIVPLHDGYFMLEKDVPLVQEFLDEVLRERLGFITKLKRKGN